MVHRSLVAQFVTCLRREKIEQGEAEDEMEESTRRVEKVKNDTVLLKRRTLF
jgi:hypothetical protein